MPPLWWIFLLSAAVLTAATAVPLGPVTVSAPAPLTGAALLSVGLAVMAALAVMPAAHGILLRTGLAPLRHLGRAMRATDLLRVLVLYRVAQESPTNAARHSRARHTDLSVRHTPVRVKLSVCDNGRGIGGTPAGAGNSGMRERAVLIGADLCPGPGLGGGAEVRLVVPHRGGSL